MPLEFYFTYLIYNLHSYSYIVLDKLRTEIKLMKLFDVSLETLFRTHLFEGRFKLCKSTPNQPVASDYLITF